MNLGIYSLKKILFQGEAESVNLKTESGEITILNNHKPLISSLKAGVIKIIDSKKREHYIPVSSGFLEVKFNKGRLIVNENDN